MKKPKKKAKVKVVKRKKEVKSDKTAGFGKVLPLGSWILIKPFTKAEISAKNSFGIILPGSDSKDKSEQGKVLAVGSGEYRDGKLISPSVKVGDKVAFSKYGFEDITVDGEEFYLIKNENILAVLK